MGTVNARVRQRRQMLYMHLNYQGKRYRQQTALEDTPANRKCLEKKPAFIKPEITLGGFDYDRHFEDDRGPRTAVSTHRTPLFRDFAPGGRQAHYLE